MYWYFVKLNLIVDQIIKCIKIKLSSVDIKEKENGSYRGFGYWILITDPINLAKRARIILLFDHLNRRVDAKDWY